MWQVSPKLHQVDQDKVASLYAQLRKESMVYMYIHHHLYVLYCMYIYMYVCEL